MTTDSPNDLLPCPFCGETDIINLTEEDENKVGKLGCANCGCENDFWEWNRRAHPPIPVTLIEEFVLEQGYTPPIDNSVPDPHIVELIQEWERRAHPLPDMVATELRQKSESYLRLEELSGQHQDEECQQTAHVWSVWQKHTNKPSEIRDTTEAERPTAEGTSQKGGSLTDQPVGETVPDDGPFPPWMLDQFTGCGIDQLDTAKTYNLTGTHLKQILQSYRSLYQQRFPERESGEKILANAVLAKIAQWGAGELDEDQAIHEIESLAIEYSGQRRRGSDDV